MTFKQQLADYALQIQAEASAKERWGKTLMMLYRKVSNSETAEEFAEGCWRHAEAIQRVGMHEQARNVREFRRYILANMVKQKRVKFEFEEIKF